MTKVITYIPGEEAQLPSARSATDDKDDYSSNIQIADLNALNAILAVNQWKRHLGFYATHVPAAKTIYKLFLNELRNGEIE